ncbi:hypothetical protein LX16_0580 [Stackebrandtia albiflava]|uniref:Uncharacterized protein n=1 Tax=Stackebrandtia albiflava TaxID=406432 RepID=A0A562VAQ0_9ACTN|nr:hypothetical protein [Stackebrandtia albiflava]TWJ14887.1 hypothetical protein LX16_0580 [Stackebrandtia albiflava]
MDRNPLFRATVKAVALGDAEEAIRLEDRIEPADREAYHLYVTAVFAALVQHHFAEDSSHAAILKFVGRLRKANTEATPPLRPLMLEGLIRVVFGEEHFLAEIPLAEQLRSQFLVINTLVVESDELSGQLDEVLTAAEDLAAHWAKA